MLRGIVLLLLGVFPSAILEHSCIQPRTRDKAPGQTVEFASNLLEITITYETQQFGEVIEDGRKEFPLTLKGKDYNLGIKRLKGVAPTLAKTPGREFFLFFSGEVVRSFAKDHRMKLVEPEEIKEFTAKGKPLALQYLHYQLPEEKNFIPSFVQEDIGEVYLYYFHFVFPPDYWNFVAISKRKLSEGEVKNVIAIIEGAKFPGEESP